MNSANEDNLLSQFRRLNTQGQTELLDFAALLLQKHGLADSTRGEVRNGQCPLHKEEKHPEAAKEPIFTE